MRRIIFVITVLVCTLNAATAQTAAKPGKKPLTLGIGIHFYDFTTPQYIRSTSLSETLDGPGFAGLRDMNPGLSLSLIKGLNHHFDFTLNYSLTTANYPFRDTEKNAGSNQLLQQMFAKVDGKMFSESAAFNPYISAGVGASAYAGGRFDAVTPLGVGLQVRLTKANSLRLDYQYVVPVTERANYHFIAGLSFLTHIGK